jgi:hypothetical protein
MLSHFTAAVRAREELQFLERFLSLGTFHIGGFFGLFRLRFRFLFAFFGGSRRRLFGLRHGERLRETRKRREGSQNEEDRAILSE